MVIRGIKGVKDILPEDAPAWQFIEQKARQWAQRYGFQEIRLPIFEQTELFARSIGATTDIVEKEMYTFSDRDGTSLTLRPEGTAGAVRAFIEHNRGADPIQQKYFYFGPMFRHERPQAGRLRQFHQFGVESLGVSDPRADVEVMALLWNFLADLGITSVTLEINSLGLLEDRARYKPVLQAFLREQQAKLCSNCRRRIDTNPLRTLDCKVPACRTATEGAPKLIDHLSQEARAYFDEVLAGLRVARIGSILNWRLVRGLDYYTQTTFEFTTPHLGAQNAVGAGGRYDGLVEALGGAAVPAVGFAAGLERIRLVLPVGSLPTGPRRVYVAAFGSRGNEVGMHLLEEIRLAGLHGDTDFRCHTLKAHLRQADRMHSALVVLVGDDEAASGLVTIRDMATKDQQQVPMKEVAVLLQQRLSSRH